MPVDLLKATQNYLNDAAAIIIVLNEAGTVEFINKAGCILLDYPVEEILGTNWFKQFLPEKMWAASLKQFEESFQKLTDQTSILHESMVLTKAGEVRHVEWTTTLLENKKGNVVGVLLSGSDITEKKALQILLASQEAERIKKNLAAIITALEQERQHISNELHDNIGQLLTTCKLILDVEISKTGSELLRGAFNLLQQAITEIRSLSHNLDPAPLKELGLVLFIKEQCRTLRQSGKYKVTAHIKGECFLKALDYDLCLSAYRIIQEQLNNILKHANARKIDIVIIGSQNFLDIEIKDNGVGFIKTEGLGGLGLRNIYNRAQLFQGKVYINSAPGKGCLLSVCFPIHPKVNPIYSK